MRHIGLKAFAEQIPETRTGILREFGGFTTICGMHGVICLPARNESAHIQDAIRRLVRSLDDERPSFSDIPTASSENDIDWQVVVAVNGTTDDTLRKTEELRMSKDEYREKLVAMECPIAGKGAAIKFVAKQTRCALGGADVNLVGDAEKGTAGHESVLFGFIDADLSSDPDAIHDLARNIVHEGADIVIASRLVQTKTTNRGMARTLSSRIFNLFSHLILGLKVKDAQCGLKIMNSRGMEVLEACHEDGWFLDIEFLAKARQYGLRVVEVPVPWIEFRYPDRRSQVRHIRDGIGAIQAMLRIRRRLRLYVQLPNTH